MINCKIPLPVKSSGFITVTKDKGTGKKGEHSSSLPDKPKKIEKIVRFILLPG